MNNLNSVLIEGVLKEDARISKGTSVCTILITSKRLYQDKDKPREVVSRFTVDVSGNLGEAVCVKGKEGRGVRVVGWLKEEQHTGDDNKSQSRVIIVADHVEFRPECKVESEKVVKKGKRNATQRLQRND